MEVVEALDLKKKKWNALSGCTAKDRNEIFVVQLQLLGKKKAGAYVYIKNTKRSYYKSA